MAMPLNASDIATVVLHYGEPSMTEGLVRDLLAGEPDAPIWVLDNHAPEPYPSAAPGFWERLTENIFWAGALEHALRRAREAGHSHLWFLNNDIRFVTPGPHVARAAARLGYFSRQCGRPVGVYSPCAQRNPYHAQMVAREGIEGAAVAYVDGIALLLDLDCVEAVGGPDCADNPIGYGVEIWLSLRAHRAGRPVVVDYKTVLKHSYHTNAARQKGFLARAAEQERGFMEKRLGPDWREQLAVLQKEIAPR